MTTKEEIPTYDEMLEMSEDDFKKWLLARIQKPHRDRLVLEMVSHETRTKSFYKTVDHELSESEQVMLDVFNPAKSADIVATFEKIDQALKDSGDVESDLLKHAIFAKATSDKMHLGTQTEVKRLLKEDEI